IGTWQMALIRAERCDRQSLIFYRSSATRHYPFIGQGLFCLERVQRHSPIEAVGAGWPRAILLSHGIDLLTYEMFAINHAATALIVKRRFPEAPMIWVLISVQLIRCRTSCVSFVTSMTGRRERT